MIYIYIYKWNRERVRRPANKAQSKRNRPNATYPDPHKQAVGPCDASTRVRATKQDNERYPNPWQWCASTDVDYIICWNDSATERKSTAKKWKEKDRSNAHSKRVVGACIPNGIHWTKRKDNQLDEHQRRSAYRGTDRYSGISEGKWKKAAATAQLLSTLFRVGHSHADHILINIRNATKGDGFDSVKCNGTNAKWQNFGKIQLMSLKW